MAIVPFRASNPNPYSPSYSEYYPVEYFSGFDLSIFFAGEYIDEICELEFTLQERQVPVYGYASYTAAKIVAGSRIVQGSFCINLRPGDYLHELLNTVAQNSGSTFLNSTANAQTSLTFTPDPNSSYDQPDPQVDPAGYALWVQNQKNLNWGASTANYSPADTSQSPYFTQSNFQILMVYGDIDAIDIATRNNGRVRSIDGVSLMSVNQSVSLDGQNIQERFSFIAKDINVPNRVTAAALYNA
jgi:hypothetical protein